MPYTLKLIASSVGYIVAMLHAHFVRNTCVGVINLIETAKLKLKGRGLMNQVVAPLPDHIVNTVNKCLPRWRTSLKDSKSL